jgi:excisionase family DNA binding protein
VRLWLTVEEAAPYLGDDPQAIYRAIREGDFPWDYVRLGRKIKISARSIGLIPSIWDGLDRQPRKSEEQPQGESLATVA